MTDKISIDTYKPGKSIESVKKQYKLSNVIKLASNENPFGPSSKAIIEVRKKLNQTNRYPESDPINLKQKIQLHLKNNRISTKNIIVGNGSNEILEFISRAYLSKNIEVIFSKHSFIVYKIISNCMNAKIIETKPIYDKNNQYLGTDLSEILRKITKKTKVIFIANPNNPTGTILDIKELDLFLSKVRKSIIVLIDEAYYEYASFYRKQSSIKLIQKYSNLIVTRTFSKIYALAGIRIGYGISSRKIIDELNFYRQPFNTNTFAQLLAVESLKDKKYVKQSLENNFKGMQYIKSEFDKLNIFYLKSYGNFITFKLGKNIKRIYNKLLSNGVILRPLDNYKLPNYLRLTIGKPSENKKFISVLKNILK